MDPSLKGAAIIGSHGSLESLQSCALGIVNESMLMGCCGLVWWVPLLATSCLRNEAIYAKKIIWVLGLAVSALFWHSSEPDGLRISVI